MSSSSRTWGARRTGPATRWECSAPTPSRPCCSRTASRRTRLTRRPGAADDEPKSRTSQSLSSEAENRVAQQQFEDLNSGFIQELFEQYLASPETVDPAWRKLFEQAPDALAESSPVVQRVRELYPGAANGGNGAPV